MSASASHSHRNLGPGSVPISNNYKNVNYQPTIYTEIPIRQFAIIGSACNFTYNFHLSVPLTLYKLMQILIKSMQPQKTIST